MKNIQKTKDILIKPIITHKSTLVASASTNKCYVFEVAAQANKHQIAQEFTRIFNAKVFRVNTAPIRRHKRFTKRGLRQKSDGKKAYIYTDTELELFPKI